MSFLLVLSEECLEEILILISWNVSFPFAIGGGFRDDRLHGFGIDH